MHASIDAWEGGLRATGGALAPEKTFWYLVDYKWTPSGECLYKRYDECPANLTVRDSDHTIHTLQRLPLDEA